MIEATNLGVCHGERGEVKQEASGGDKLGKKLSVPCLGRANQGE